MLTRRAGASRRPPTELGLQNHSGPHVQTAILPLITLVLLSRAAESRGASLALVETLAVRSASGERLEGRLDWTAATLTVTGEAAAGGGASPAQQRLAGFRAARTAALSGLLEAVGGVRIDGRTTVRAAMAADDSVRRRVRELSLIHI